MNCIRKIYTHPHANVMNRLADHGIKNLWIDKHRTIITIRKNSIKSVNDCSYQKNKLFHIGELG